MGESASDRIFRETFPSQLGVYHQLIDDVVAELGQRGWEKAELFGVQMALEESISNAIRHGNKHDAEKTVDVEIRVTHCHFWARICDEGPGFCREEIPDCRDDERLEVPGGRGLALIEAYMDIVEYNACGNCLTLSKRSATPDCKPES